MQAELEALEKALQVPARPVVAVVGGAKVSTKLAILANLVARVDRLVIGGAMANTFLQAQGVAIGASLAEPDLAADARRIMAEAEGSAGCEIVLPDCDVVVTREFREGAESTVGTPVGRRAGGRHDPRSGASRPASRIEAALAASRTLVWNGPLGRLRDRALRPRHGDVRPCRRPADGGGRAALGRRRRRYRGRAPGHAGVLDAFSYVSTAGGAFLEWLEGKDPAGGRCAGGGRIPLSGQ